MSSNLNPLFERFRVWLVEAGRSEHTISGYIQDLLLFEKYFQESTGESLTPGGLTPTDIRLYRQHLQQGKAKPSTINRKLAALRAFGEFLHSQGLAAENPAAGVQRVESQELGPKWLDRREQAALMRELERERASAWTDAARRQAVRDWTMAVLLLNTGLRIAELCALELGDLELSERKGAVIVRRGKGGKARRVPVNRAAREALSTWLELRPEGGSRLFSSKRGGEGLSVTGVYRRLLESGRRAKVQVTPHVLRHTFAKNLVDSGVSLDKVALLLGHSRLDTTMIYTRPCEGDLLAAVQLLV